MTKTLPFVTALPATDPRELPGLRVWAHGASDVGLVREHNEDSYLMADLTQADKVWSAEGARPVGPRGVLFVVCDGMGGAAAGEIASEWATDTVYTRMLAVMQDHRELVGDELPRALVQALEAANRRIFEEGARNRERRGMGTTTTAAILVGDHLFMAQIGDSRAYIMRDQALTQVTRDQSLVNQLLEAGSLTEEEAETFEHQNVILQALGTGASIDVDVTHAHLRPGDLLLLCSDGLSGLLKEADLRDAILASSDPRNVCQELIHRAKGAGGHDNITVIAVRIEGRLDEAQSPSDDAIRFQRYEFADRPAAITQPLPAASENNDGKRIETGDANQPVLAIGAASSSQHAPEPSPLIRRVQWWVAVLLWMVVISGLTLLLLPRI